MRDHPRAVPGCLNGSHAGQKLWFSLKGPNVFPSRHCGLNALREALARRSEIDGFDAWAGPPFQLCGRYHDLRIREDLRVRLVVHEAIDVVAMEMGNKDCFDCL